METKKKTTKKAPTKKATKTTTKPAPKAKAKVSTKFNFYKVYRPVHKGEILVYEGTSKEEAQAVADKTGGRLEGKNI